MLEHHFVREKDGRLTLKTDKAERKATGTYYTPDYIVKYIVDQTIRPLLDEIEASAPVQSARAASRQDNSFADAVLQLNVCDPAMGSGHFLVEATTFLADQIVYHPTTKFQAAKEKGVPQEQTEIAYWRRRVVESCIYAIDLNPLAVELAKLSLWLTTIASDQPLNFLDHHLCCANSLIGACIDQLGALPKRKKSRGKSHKIDKQTRFSFGPDFKRVISETIRQIHSIEEKASAEVKEKEKRWQEKVLPALAPYKAVADLWTSTFFGNALDEETYLAGAQKILAGDKVNNPQASTRRFFHWELEFPEVFFADDGAPRTGPGFDAMISNPPYIDIKGLDDGMVDYLFEVFPTARLRVNIFAAFIEQSIVEARAQFGHVGLIIPTAFLTQVSYSQLRQLILQNYSLKKLVRLPNELFGAAAGEVKVDTCVVVVQKKPTVSARTECLIYNSFQRVTQLSSETASTAFEREQQKWLAEQDAPITLAAGDDENVLAKMRSKCIALDAVCEFCLGLTPYDKYAGHTKEQIEKRVFHANSQLDPSYKRLLVSGDVRRYEVEWNGEQWIKYGDWLAAPREQRFFTEPRILVQQIIDWSSLRILAGWTDEELYNTQNQFNLLAKADTNLKFVLALLNSKLISYYHRRAFLDVALQRFQKILIKDAKTFPIRRIELSTPAKHRAALLEKAKQLVAEAVAENDAGEVVRFVEEQLAPQPERADVVHDLLGFLAGEMTRLNSEKLAAAHGFIVDLKDFHGIDAYALTPKTRLNEFWKLDAPEFLRICARMCARSLRATCT